MDFLFSFLGFTFITLTARTGIPQLLGIVAMLLPGILPKNRFVKLLTYYFAIVSVAIFFCYSSFYSNDLGWKVIRDNTDKLDLAMKGLLKMMCGMWQEI